MGRLPQRKGLCRRRPSGPSLRYTYMEHERFKVLQERFHFSDFREGQEEIIETLVSGRDVVAVMPTGSGKSLCYQLPALLLEGITLVVSPLIALMQDQVDVLRRNQIPAAFINSTLNWAEQRQRLREVEEGKFKLVYIAPERFRQPAFIEAVQRCRIALVAVDEAHCVSEWGHDFRPDYLRLKGVIANLNHPSVAALTATATPEVRRDIVEQLGLKNPFTIVTGFDRPNLRLQVKAVETEAEKLIAILRLLTETQGAVSLPENQNLTDQAEAVPRSPASGIVYAATRKNVEFVTEALRAKGHRVGSYHAGMDMESRKSAQEQFMSGALPFVVATNAFGMGIDKADLRFIVHYDVPGSLEAYYQEVGRAGRDGKPATCLLLFNYADTFTQEFFIDSSYPPRELVEEVYETVCRMGSDEVEVTVKALAQQLSYLLIPSRSSSQRATQSGKPSDLAVSASLKILEKAGYIERGTEGGHQAKVTLRAATDSWDATESEPLNNKTPSRGSHEAGQGHPTMEARPDLHRAQRISDLQRQVLAYCADVLGARKNQRVAVDLQAAATDLLVTPDQIRRALSALHQFGHIEYKAPFRGRGLKILKRISVSELDINFAEIERRAQFERRKLRKMVGYAYTRECLRRFLLEYFGERVAYRQCHNCSNCQESGRAAQPGLLTDEETIVVRKILSCVARMKGRYGRMRVAQVLTGSKIEAAQYLGLDRLSTFGILKELSQPQILAIIDSLVEFKLLRIEGTEYPLVQLTPEGRDVMVGKAQASMVFPIALKKKSPDDTVEGKSRGVRTRSRRGAGAAEGRLRSLTVDDAFNDPTLPFHEELFNALREMRRRIASAAGLPPYIIFHDETLRAISRQLPKTVGELQAVRGVGQRKIAAYGEETLRVVAAFLKAHPKAAPIRSASDRL